MSYIYAIPSPFELIFKFHFRTPTDGLNGKTMKKKDVISALKNNSFQNGIADIRCDVVIRNKTYENESILVIVDKYNKECIDDQILVSKHCTIFDSVSDFVKSTVFANPLKPFDPSKTVVKNFVSVKDFVSDFEPKDKNGEKISIGDKVRWYDPEEDHRQLDRIYTITKVNGCQNDDVILLTDDVSEVEVFASEIEKVN